VCPNADLIAPFTCITDNFYVGGTDLVNFKSYFTFFSNRLTSKIFKTIEISNEAITEIALEDFKDVVFTDIVIKNAKNLKRIFSHESNTIASNIETFKQTGESHLGEESAHVMELFQALSTLVNVKTIILADTKIKYIPDNAFNNIKQDKLTHLEINSGLITTVGDRAFFYLNGLTFLKLENQVINHVSIHAFDFFKASTVTLEIYLNENSLSDSSLAVNSFLGAHRPVRLDLSNNKLTFLVEDIFRPILDANVNTKIDVKNNQLNCNCLNYWLVVDKAIYGTQVLNAVCADTRFKNKVLFDLRPMDFIDIGCESFFE